MNKHYQRAQVLFGQGRYDMAVSELREALTFEPDDGYLHAMLALCLLELKQEQEATTEAERAIHLAPDLAFGHYVLARTLLERNWYDEAFRANQEALRLDSRNAAYHGLQALIWYARRDWAATLDAANEGLAIDPVDAQCNNLRAMALTQLGRKDEAGATLAENLARDPEDPWSHANQGWALLHQREHRKALEHFREALRLEPGNEFARAGIIEAMKARNPIYGLLLRYFLWMGRLSGSAQWAVILGLFFGNRLLRDFANANPAWKPWITPLLVLYIAFALMTWIAKPLFNLLLRLNRFGRLVLSREETVASNVIGAFVLPALLGLGAWLWFGSELAFVIMVFFGLMLLPLSATFECSKGWPRKMMLIYTVVLGLAAVGAVPLTAVNPGGAVILFQLFLWGSFLSGFVANALIMSTVRR